MMALMEHSVPSETLLTRTCSRRQSKMSMKFSHDAQKGDTIQEIAAELELDEQYVYNIQVSAQGFREDDEIAVAHLVMMG